MSNRQTTRCRKSSAFCASAAIGLTSPEDASATSLLNREPADYDVATDATPRQVMQIFPQTFAVGEQFGVVLVPEPKPVTDDDARRSTVESPLPLWT